MEAENFIKQKLEQLVVRFSQIKVRYEYDEDSNIHLIEVLPHVVYKTDTEYGNSESEIINEFINTFPNQGICFISEESLLQIVQAQYEIIGLNYEITNRALENDHYNISWLDKISFDSLKKVSVDCVSVQLSVVAFNSHNNFLTSISVDKISDSDWIRRDILSEVNKFSYPIMDKESELTEDPNLAPAA